MLYFLIIIITETDIFSYRILRSNSLSRKDFSILDVQSLTMADKILDLIWSLDIEKMNDHLPTERKTLAELIKTENPTVNTKKNKLHKIRKKDLDLVCSFLPENEWDKLKLPIVLLRRTELDKGLFSVSGGIRELYVVSRISGRTAEEYPLFIIEEHQPYIWKPEAFTAIRKAGSIIIIGYT